ncbi:glutamate racemase [Candidatus Mycosynbacter amalyticus]|uniref:Glutamate racemase n=1 Tax=Candidatus Mycosynbacter amalyticus TaxID=2665156 RepID=A0A857MK28_9BACT|nr:aspartate/glutamate racemase family protein [Candidatus Mycosynbacter amalyticus]QHN42488.1 glutamate racemase [Candidatus Mycosynbacter amalyticus]
MKLGVFDSGIGGEAVAVSLREYFPSAKVVTVNDRGNVPYGNKSPAQVRRLTELAIQPLLDGSCDMIVLACNTATAFAIEQLRAKYPTQKFIGLEPMIKPAAELTRTGIVAVCATPGTLTSTRYARLVQRYGSSLHIITPDCSQWAYWIENNQLNQEHIAVTVNEVCEKGADIIVLGCTHYHWIKELIIELAAGRAQVLEPSEAIGRRIELLLQLR